ncbi:hypothetical protein AB6A40_000432 [Gnathostoma spinigerum]|uniref:RUN domain-containing protein n=1 Tax=Gnathostoma spinigerum TaxID=75299 RepID=A0ABD6EAF4_9BILA
MVELCGLKIIDQGLEGAWPSDIDQHIAQLDFDRSTEDEQNSLFSSVGLNPSIISTDSLDMEKMHARCEVNKNNFKITFDDSEQWASGNLTTWGRIRSTEPLYEKTSSLPDMKGRRSQQESERDQRRRPSSLLATFVERQPGYEYSELYVGNGRYVDVNDNEIGFVPQNTTALQSADRWRHANRLAALTPTKPRRTFADFRSNQLPHLDFMAVPYEMPNLCHSARSLSEIIIKAREGDIGEDKMDVSVISALENRYPDSGLGSSASANSGPLHIEDWPSLAVLLPKNVVEACSFFKQNNQLLVASNSIERSTPKRSEACRTCFGIRKRLHPPMWAQPSNVRKIFCDCSSSEIIDGRSRAEACESRSTAGRFKLHAQELSIIGLPIYDAKRALVEKVIKGIAEVARGNSELSLCSALETLIADGLKDNNTWNMITTITARGPATSNVYAIVKSLEHSKQSPASNARTFFRELLRLNSIDCWICYVVLKEDVLKKLYNEGAFLLRASTSYRSLLWRLVENLELLMVIDHHIVDFKDKDQEKVVTHLEACHIPSDSRVPKSSSMPSRLANQSRPAITLFNSNHCWPQRTSSMRPSKIPHLKSRPRRSMSSFPTAKCSSHSVTFASAVEDMDEPGLLPVSRGERLQILAWRGIYAHCCRLRAHHGRVLQGLLPKSKLRITRSISNV